MKVGFSGEEKLPHIFPSLYKNINSVLGDLNIKLLFQTQPISWKHMLAMNSILIKEDYIN